MDAVKYYAGIGSRNAPPNILGFMTKVASILEQKGYVLRSGGAKGSDSYFAKGATKKEIFKSSDAQPWAYETVKRYIPTDRPQTFDSWDPYVRGLLARNMMQVLGRDGNTPVDFIVCWTPQGDYQTSEVGGTGYAIRCALDRSIPIYNLSYPEQLEAFKTFIRGLYQMVTLDLH